MKMFIKPLTSLLISKVLLKPNKFVAAQGLFKITKIGRLLQFN